MRKLLFKCLALAVVFTMAGCSDELSALSNPEQSSVGTVGQEEICLDQSKALEAFSDLKDFYGLNTKSLQDDSKSVYFPDYYGGSYLDGNKLVVYIKKGTENLPLILTENPNIILKESDFSFNYLSSILSEMNKIYLSSGAKLNPVIGNIEMFGLSETNNRIEVYLYDCSNTAISDFKHYMMDSPAICFIQSQCQQEDFMNFIGRLKSATFRTSFTVNPKSSIGTSPDLYSNPVKVSSNVADEKSCELQMDSVFPVSQRRIPIKIINHMDNAIEMGRNDYKLEFYNESSQTWENALPESHAYLMITDVVLPHDTLELTIYEYTGRAGKYRVTKNATVTDDLSRKSHDYILSGKFRLSKEDDSINLKNI
ncbi:hypothetical protein [Parabacteroides sp.]